MKIYKFVNKKMQDIKLSELLSQAETSDGEILFYDDLEQIWKLEKVVETELSQ